MGLNMGFDKGFDQCLIEAVDRLKDEMIDSILELVRIDSVEGELSLIHICLRLMDTDFQRTERQRKVVMLALEKAKQADVSTLTSLATYMIPQISTSVGVNDVVPLVKDIKKYHIGDTAGFPFSRQTKRVGRMDCVIPTTLESNVVLLHQFLYLALIHIFWLESHVLLQGLTAWERCIFRTLGTHITDLYGLGCKAGHRIHQAGACK